MENENDYHDIINNVEKNKKIDVALIRFLCIL